MEQRDQLKLKTTVEGKTLRQRLQFLQAKPDFKARSLFEMGKHVEQIKGLGDKLPTSKVPSSITWLNTQNDEKWSFSEQLKGKFVVVDFWSSCCINCIHVLAEMDRLEQLFEGMPEVAFVGCHSAKFENEKDLHMLRQAVIRYDIRHAVINDNQFEFWGSNRVNCWPTVMVFSPDSKPLYKQTGEGCEDSIAAVLAKGLEECANQLESSEGKSTDWINFLSSHELPLDLEKNKHLSAQTQNLSQAAGNLCPEAITALRQNMSHPGKVITARAQDDEAPLPYEGVGELLIVADSSNNRFLILNADTNRFIEQIGNGKIGYVEGQFGEAEFYHTQGMCHFVNADGHHCLLLCDVKNHLIREANLHTKQVRHISGVKGVRGHDLTGGRCEASKQELCSPWDLVKAPSGEFIIAMAGTHQIWQLDTRDNKCKVYSGSGAEGNTNSNERMSTWAQPSGITAGPFQDELTFFIADSESSAIRGISFDTQRAVNVAGANSHTRDLFDFGDSEGMGYNAKLQHPLGVHFCRANQTLYVADTYNHKIKAMSDPGSSSLSRQTALKNWLGTSADKNPRVEDGVGADARLNEPNGCWARVSPSDEFLGLYIADTGNDCIRFAHADGRVETLDLKGIPDVRATASANCSGGVCKVNFGEEEEEKKQE